MKRYLLVIIALLFSSTLFSQEVLMDETPDSLYTPKKWGPNRANYVHFYVAYGMAAGLPEGNAFDLKYSLSREWRFGVRYKRRICNHYAMGLDLSLSSYRYRILQNNSKQFPDSLLHEKQYLQLPTVGLEYFNRINIGRRGDRIGNYLDLGAYATYTYSPTLTFIDKLSPSFQGASEAKVELSELDYITDTQWGFKARLGINRYVLWASYRMSDWLKTTGKHVDLPRTTVGLEIGLF